VPDTEVAARPTELKEKPQGLFPQPIDLLNSSAKPPNWSQFSQFGASCITIASRKPVGLSDRILVDEIRVDLPRPRPLVLGDAPEFGAYVPSD
jgi:hypothetical protein